MICRMHMWSSGKVCLSELSSCALFISCLSVGVFCPEPPIICSTGKYLSYHQGLLTARIPHVTEAYLYPLTTLRSQITRQYTSYFKFVILKVVNRKYYILYSYCQSPIGSSPQLHNFHVLNSCLGVSGPFLIRIHHVAILQMCHQYIVTICSV